MLRKLWFKKDSSPGGSGDSKTGESGSSDGSAVMGESVFPTGLEEDAEDFSGGASDFDLNKIKRDIETVKKSVIEYKRTLKNEVPSGGSESGAVSDGENASEADKKEAPVNYADNRGGPTFKTAPIPGVVDGGKRGGKPVMTPVRMAASASPIRLKTLSETQKNLERSQSSVQSQPKTSALNVVSGERSSQRPQEGRSRFGLHPREKTEPLNLESAPSSGEPSAPVAAVASVHSADSADSAVSADYVKPKADQRVLYFQLMNGLYDAILLLDDHGHVVDCNERVKKVLGYTREDAWDLPISNVIKGMGHQMFAHLKKTLRENHNVLITARCFKSNGDSFKAEIGVSTLSLTSSSNVVFAIRNVDQRKSTMAELRKAGAAFDISLAATFACNPDGFFTNVNKAMMESFGISDAKQALKVRVFDVLPDVARSFAKALSGNDIHETLVVADARRQVVKIEIALAPIKNGSELIGVAGSILPA